MSTSNQSSKAQTELPRSVSKVSELVNDAINTFQSFFFKAPVTIRVGVGARQRDFFIAEDLLRKHSPFFDAALNVAWKESDTNIVELPEDDVNAFQIYSCWLYGLSPFVEPDPKMEKQQIDLEYHRLGPAWDLGHKILDRDFCDMIIDRMLDLASCTSHWPALELIHIFKLCSENDPSRLLLCDVYTHVSDLKWYNDPSEGMDVEVWRAIATTLFKMMETKNPKQTRSKRPWKKDRCQYHWHTKDGKECYKTKYSPSKSS